VRKTLPAGAALDPGHDTRRLEHRTPDFGLRAGAGAVVLATGLGRTRSRGELLSFLLFDHTFIEELMKLGRRDARRWLRRHPRFWCRDAAHDLSMGSYDSSATTEQEAIEEFRSRRLR
jgi:hypothetical protein